MITRNNYEAFFLLYVDNELPAADREAVEQFVRENSDLESELTGLLQSTFKPESSVVFGDKSALMKKPAGASFINTNNYEYWFLLYADKELDEAAAKEVEAFAGGHPSLLESLQLLLQTRVEPDMTVVFDKKEILYKKEDDEKVIAFPWFRVAAAAVVLIVAGFFVFTNRMPATPPVASANTTTATGKEKNSAKDIPVENKKDEPAVTSTPVVPLDITGTTKQQMGIKTTRKELPAYAHNLQKENKNRDAGNTTVTGFVQPGKNELAKTNTGVVDIAKTNPGEERTENSARPADEGTLHAQTGKSIELATPNKAEPNYATLALQENNSANGDDVFYLANTAPKKNKLRGLFRKVSRVLDKNANADDDNKHGVLIGGFQIALK